jgi:hypothetical protein
MAIEPIGDSGGHFLRRWDCDQENEVVSQAFAEDLVRTVYIFREEFLVEVAINRVNPVILVGGNNG